MQLDMTVTGPLDPGRLHDAVQTVINRHPNLAAWFCQRFDQPVQIIPAEPHIPWQYVEFDDMDMPTSRSDGCAPPNAPRSATSPTSRSSGWR